MESTMVSDARAIGMRHGKNAASNVFDGNTSKDTYRTTLKGIEEGDPAVMDAYRVPDFSGEFADSYDERSLYEDLYDRYPGPEDYSEGWDEDVEAYEEGARTAFWDELERICRYQLRPDAVALSICADCRIVLANDDWSGIPDSDVIDFELRYHAGIKRELDGRAGNVVPTGECTCTNEDEDCECDELGICKSKCDICGDECEGSRFKATVVFND